MDDLSCWDAFLLLIVEFCSLNARNTAGQGSNEISTGRADLAFLSVPDGLVSIACLAFLSCVVKNRGSAWALASSVDEGVGAALSAVLNCDIPNSSKLANSAIICCVIPFCITSDTSLVTVEVRLILGATALRSGIIPSETIRTTNTSFVLGVP